MKKLERNLIDNILESEVKLGCASTPVTFYYPESSLNELLDCNDDELPVKIAEFMEIKSLLIKDTTKEERERIVKESMDCGGGCENCSSCWLGGGSPWDIYQDYIDGKRELKEINAEYMEQYRQGRNIM